MSWIAFMLVREIVFTSVVSTWTGNLFNGQKILLRCHGLGTVARVFVNERLVAETENMFRCYDLDGSEYVVEGENTVRIEFDTPLPMMKEKYSKHTLSCWNEPYSVEGRV